MKRLASIVLLSVLSQCWWMPCHLNPFGEKLQTSSVRPTTNDVDLINGNGGGGVEAPIFSQFSSLGQQPNLQQQSAVTTGRPSAQSSTVAPPLLQKQSVKISAANPLLVAPADPAIYEQQQLPIEYGSNSLPPSAGSSIAPVYDDQAQAPQLDYGQPPEVVIPAVMPTYRPPSVAPPPLVQPPASAPINCYHPEVATPAPISYLPQPEVEQPAYVQTEYGQAQQPPAYVQPDVQQAPISYSQPEPPPLVTYSAPTSSYQQPPPPLVPVSYGNNAPVQQQQPLPQLNVIRPMVPMFSPPDTLTYGQLQGVISRPASIQDDYRVANRPSPVVYQQNPPSNYNVQPEIPDVPASFVPSSAPSTAPAQDSYGNQFNLDLRSLPQQQQQPVQRPPQIISYGNQQQQQQQQPQVQQIPQDSYGNNNVPQSQPPIRQSQGPVGPGYANGNKNLQQFAPPVPSQGPYASGQHQVAPPSQGPYGNLNFQQSQGPSNGYAGNNRPANPVPRLSPSQSNYGDQFDFDEEHSNGQLAPSGPSSSQTSYRNNEILQQQGYGGAGGQQFNVDADSYGHIGDNNQHGPPSDQQASAQPMYGNFDAGALGVLPAAGIQQRPRNKGRAGYGK